MLKPTFRDESRVYLEGKHIGTIKPCEGGYAYFPKDCKASFRGEVFKTIENVKLCCEIFDGYYSAEICTGDIDAYVLELYETG